MRNNLLNHVFCQALLFELDCETRRFSPNLDPLFMLALMETRALRKDENLRG
jgi:hypothetical protein